MLDGSMISCTLLQGVERIELENAPYQGGVQNRKNDSGCA